MPSPCRVMIGASRGALRCGPEASCAARTIGERTFMLRKDMIWQKWSRLVVTLFVVWSLWALIGRPLTGLAQDKHRLDNLSGVFTVTIAKSDVPQNLADGRALEGIWSVDFGSD